jgi:phosphate transport system permease protein
LGSSRRQAKEAAIGAAFRFAAVISVLISAAIVLSLAREAFAFLATIEPSQLWSAGWFPRRGMFDIKTILAGTILVTCIAMVVAVPLGIGAAVYLAEFASPRVRKMIKPVLEILASVPSVVLGFFALTWIAPRVVDGLCAQSSAFNMAAAGIGVGILVTPLIASVSEDALRAVPTHLREASYGLGADRFSTTIKVVFPAAISGVVAALIIGVSRAIGETMVVAIAAGATGGSLFSIDACQPGQTMTAAMASLAVGSDRVGQAGAVESLFFVGMVLFAMTLFLNLISERFVRRVRERY